MTKQLYSAEEVAAQLGLHVRTVRGYIRDERLRAVRIGKQYRVTREDLEAFLGAPVADPPEVGRHRHVDVSTVVGIDAVSPETAHRVSTLLTAMRGEPGDQPVRVSTAYDEERGRMKVVVIAGLADTRAVLEYLQAVLDS
ncbi:MULTISPECIES: helix-turn-helix domain-containing protein [Actinokineospora]|uniref:MerR family transcriptional regulator n=1 Tax=Actinokineospora fastidiosa TaxID=1816 RepID=A0A918GIM5_9PSEU|nr:MULTISPECIES: helix-turn-helix domain-containing protein [Actinokineospora]UVS80412.1 DNA binding domain, excisionase family [Actinokineospora sp. UTMC 2448]GGS35096.1 MerR family transcriptional regulator [Actinokineospora fastidiosa]